MHELGASEMKGHWYVVRYYFRKNRITLLSGTGEPKVEDKKNKPNFELTQMLKFSIISVLAVLYIFRSVF